MSLLYACLLENMFLYYSGITVEVITPLLKNDKEDFSLFRSGRESLLQWEWEIGHNFSETKHWWVFEGWREITESLQKRGVSVNGLLHLLIMRLQPLET